MPDFFVFFLDGQRKGADLAAPFTLLFLIFRTFHKVYDGRRPVPGI